ncbi:hypothetical protein EON63_15945 [archaeon]|nr:MAG: hypothetical protein EON63_15945 [archaeon]
MCTCTYAHTCIHIYIQHIHIHIHVYPYLRYTTYFIFRPLLEYILRKAGYVIEPLTYLEQLAPNLAQLQQGELLDTGVLCIVLGVFITGDTIYIEEMFKEVAMNFEAGIFYLSRHSRISGHFELSVRL